MKKQDNSKVTHLLGFADPGDDERMMERNNRLMYAAWRKANPRKAALMDSLVAQGFLFTILETAAIGEVKRELGGGGFAPRKHQSS